MYVHVTIGNPYYEKLFNERGQYIPLPVRAVYRESCDNYQFECHFGANSAGVVYVTLWDFHVYITSYSVLCYYR